jgi:polysaccharide biosynthesis/export protein VpsN
MTFFKRFVLFIGLCVVCAASWAQTASGAHMDSETFSKYRLSTGDVISITVLGEEDLKRDKIRLTDAGTISYPVLGEIAVRGKTIGELETMITEGLRGRYLVNPRVSVTIDEYRPFFINGQVGRIGSYPYQPGLTVRKAVTIAGGFTERASENKIFVVRDRDPAHVSVKVDLNTPIYPGDIVTVGESFF